MLDGLRCRVEVGETALGRLGWPLGGVAVAREDDVAVLLIHLGHGITRLHAALDLLGERTHARGHYCVADHHRERAVLRGTDCAELVAVAAEGEGRRAVAVLDVGLHGHGRLAARGLQLLLRLELVQGASRDHRVHVRLEASARVERDDGRGRLLGSEAVVVACVCHGTSQHLVVLHDSVGEAGQGRSVDGARFVCLARVEEINARVGADRPIRVLAAAVYASERLLVKQHHQAVLGRNPVTGLHEVHVVVRRPVGHSEDR
mmetsp:Transcript_44864/g.116633  ORF Transcript_44864/g.116633 Transcript_44864/m.116633 type:complete len:261 (-) Transcript_44864:748-1530(-)